MSTLCTVISHRLFPDGFVHSLFNGVQLHLKATPPTSVLVPVYPLTSAPVSLRLRLHLVWGEENIKTQTSQDAVLRLWSFTPGQQGRGKTQSNYHCGLKPLTLSLTWRLMEMWSSPNVQYRRRQKKIITGVSPPTAPLPPPQTHTSISVILQPGSHVVQQTTKRAEQAPPTL